MFSGREKAISKLVISYKYILIVFYIQSLGMNVKLQFLDFSFIWNSRASNYEVTIINKDTVNRWRNNE